MASEKEANLARAQHSAFLRKLGAHSIGVDECKHQGETGFAVIAFFDQKPYEKVPQTLKVKSGKQTVAVPLEVEIMKMPRAD